eukprot:1186649-Prorocentrum_minimum.AAC.2
MKCVRRGSGGVRRGSGGGARHSLERRENSRGPCVTWLVTQVDIADVAEVDAGYVGWIALTGSGEVFTCHTGYDGYAGTLPQKVAPNAQGEMGREGDPRRPGRVEGALRGEPPPPLELKPSPAWKRAPIIIRVIIISYNL